MNPIEAAIVEVLAEVDQALRSSCPQKLDRCCFLLYHVLRNPEIESAKPYSKALLLEGLVSLQRHRRRVYEVLR